MGTRADTRTLFGQDLGAEIERLSDQAYPGADREAYIRLLQLRGELQFKVQAEPEIPIKKTLGRALISGATLISGIHVGTEYNNALGLALYAAGAVAAGITIRQQFDGDHYGEQLQQLNCLNSVIEGHPFKQTGSTLE